MYQAMSQSTLLVSLLFCLFSDLANAENPNHSRIIGGQPASLGQIPWQVSLRINGRHTCGGSILTQNWVVTAAHCFQGTGAVDVAVGFLTISSPESSQQIIKVSQFLLHYGYSPDTDENDIAMVQLATNIRFNSNIKPINLPSQSFVPDGGIGRVSGWGATGSSQLSDQLLWVDVPIMDDDFCREFLGSIIVDTMVCAGYEEGGKDACSGDSGGPLTCTEGSSTVLCGIVSKGLGCAEPDRPGIYTETSHFLEWIADTINAKSVENKL